MGALKNIGLNGYFKRYGKKYGFLRGIFMANPFHIVKSNEIKKILYYGKIKKRLEKKYYKASNVSPTGLNFKDIDNDNPIWVYWNQGIDNAPDIVKTCINSVRQKFKNEVILISDENLNDYLELPEYITTKMKKGYISSAAYADLIRLCLIEHFGGTWIDATVYLMDEIPDYIMDSDVFMFQDSFGLIDNPAKISNWFIHAKPACPIIQETRNMLFEYFRRENYVMEYLIVYIFLTISFAHHKDIYENMPYVNSEYSRILFSSLDKEYNLNKLNYIKRLSPIQKLSYKLTDDVYLIKDDFYNRIIGDKYEDIKKD